MRLERKEWHISKRVDLKTFFSRSGNVEIILYALELLNQFDEVKFEKESRHRILCEIIRIVEVLCKSSNSEDVMIFLSQNNGFQFIAKLLKNVRLMRMIF